MLVRTASNAYFPQMMSVISLPDRDEAVAKAVDQVWEHYLQYVEDLDDLAKERKRKPPVAGGPGRLHRRGGLRGDPGPQAGPDAGRRQVGQAGRVRDARRPPRRRSARTSPTATSSPAACPTKHWDQPWMARGRAGRPGPSAPRGDRDRSASPASRSSSPGRRGRAGDRRHAGRRWPGTCPGSRPSRTGARASSSSSSSEAIDAWLKKPAVQAARRAARGAASSAGRRTTTRASGKFSGLPYFLLHSLSHLLITAVSLECGYPASSIRERIYAGTVRLRHPALHRARPTPRARWAGWSRPAARSPGTCKAAIDLGPALLQRPGLRPARAARTSTSAGSCTARPATAACSSRRRPASSTTTSSTGPSVISTVDGNGAEFFRQDGS